jgi:hypothetical protein
LQGGIAVFRRNVHTGGLVQLAGGNGCVTAQGLERCARARSIPRIGGTDVAVDRNGQHLYAASGDRIAAFDRLRGGGLRQLSGLAGCISHLGEGGCAPARTLENGVVGLAASPGGFDSLYATASFSVFGGASFNGAVANLARDPATGALSQPAGPAGCISSGGALGCASTHSEMLGPGAIAVSQDGRNAYAVLTVELGGDGVVAFRRNRSTGELAQLPGRAGCIARNPPYTNCTDSRGLSATAIALSRDGRNAYVTSGGFAPGTIPGTGGVRPRAPDALAVYKRAR